MAFLLCFVLWTRTVCSKSPNCNCAWRFDHLWYRNQKHICLKTHVFLLWYAKCPDTVSDTNCQCVSPWTSGPVHSCQHTWFLLLVFSYYFLLTVIAFSALTLSVGRQEGHPACKKTEWWGAGVVVSLEWGVDLHTAQLMPLPLTVSCFSKIRIGFTFVVPAHPGSPGKGPLNGCVCVFLLTGSIR